ncbi:H-NS family nucleoid-associated regulatory protein [Methylomonas sp. 2BW1-5-20]
MPFTQNSGHPQAWNGVGPKPKWLKEWAAEGKDISDLLIEKP